MRILAALVLIALSSGCQYRSYREGTTSYTSISLGTSQSISRVKLVDGTRSLEIGGFTTDQTTVGTSAISVVQGLAK